MAPLKPRSTPGSPSRSRGRRYHQRALAALASARHEVVFTCSPEAPIIVARILTIAVSAQARCSLLLPVLPTVFPGTVAPPVRRLVGIAIPTALQCTRG